MLTRATALTLNGLNHHKRLTRDVGTTRIEVRRDDSLGGGLDARRE